MKHFLFSLCVFALVPFSASFANFSDISEDHRFYDAIEFMQNEGIVSGYADGFFRPENTITLPEAMKIILEANKVEGLEIYGPQEWQEPYMEWAYSNGITDAIQNDRNLDIGLYDMSRGEVAYVIQKISKKEKHQDSIVEIKNTIRSDRADLYIDQYVNITAQQLTVENSISINTNLMNGVFYSINPYGDDTCSEYLYSNCINIFVSVDGEITYYDSLKKSLGVLIGVENGTAFYSFSGGEGADCSGGFTETVNALIWELGILNTQVYTEKDFMKNCDEAFENDSIIPLWKTTSSVKYFHDSNYYNAIGLELTHNGSVEIRDLNLERQKQIFKKEFIKNRSN